jgi:hypothetical protein
MTMNGPIAPKDDDHVDLIRSGGQANLPLDIFVSLERPKVSRRTSQPEDGSGSHVRGRE